MYLSVREYISGTTHPIYMLIMALAWSSPRSVEIRFVHPFMLEYDVIFKQVKSLLLLINRQQRGKRSFDANYGRYSVEGLTNVLFSSGGADEVYY